MTDLFGMSPELFGVFAHLIEQKTGLHYGIQNRDLLASKLSLRTLEAGFPSSIDYYYKLRYDDPDGTEFAGLVEAIVVGETYFFRESDTLAAIIDRFLHPIVIAGARPRVWSAACATGEEPLTLAMMLDERGMLDRVDITATDISGRALQIARVGRYPSRSLRALPGEAVGRWIAVEGDTGTVRPFLLKAIDWRRANLVDAEAIRQLGVFDAILCRNVLIYFEDSTAMRVLSTLSDALTPEGVLAVGVSESLLRLGTCYECQEHGGAFVYRKARRP